MVGHCGVEKCMMMFIAEKERAKHKNVMAANRQ